MMQDGTFVSRGFQTKMNIVRALQELSESKSFSRISVDDIAGLAKISRSSFYHHFSDKNAVVQWHSFLLYGIGLDQIGRTLSWFEGHLITTKGFERYSTLYTNAAQSGEYSGGLPTYIRHRQENLQETIVKYKKIELTPQLKFQIEALANAEGTISFQWLNKAYTFSIREYSSLMTNIVPKELFDLLDKPVDPNKKKGDFLLHEELFM